MPEIDKIGTADNLYSDPISVLSMGTQVGNISSNLTLLPGDELAFHFDTNLSISEVGTASGIVTNSTSGTPVDFGNSVCISVPESSMNFSLLSISSLGIIF